MSKFESRMWVASVFVVVLAGGGLALVLGLVLTHP